jgi:P-type Cu+ transporter
MTSVDPPPPPSAEDRLELAIAGMTCAACARRVEKALRRAPGVSDALVNLATHRATVIYAPTLTGAGALEAAVADAGYRASPAAAGEAAAGEEAGGRRLVVAIAAGLPVVVLAMSHGLLAVPGAAWLQLALSLPVLAAAWPIYRAAAAAVRHLAADMNVLVALGTLAAFGYSAVMTIVSRGAAPVYFEAAVAVLALVLLGRWLEARARHRAGEALGRLRRLVPPTASVLVGEGDAPAEERRAVERLVAGDRVVIRPGQTIPIDGEVIDGASSVAEAVLTGEAMPLDKRPGDEVFAGTRNGWGRLVVRARGDAATTALARIVTAVEAALGSRAPIARVADRVAGVFTPIVLGVAVATFAVWLVAGRALPVALVHAVAVLVVACPCALGLATPTALMVGLGRGAELGVLFKSAAALEHLGSIDTLVVDKTGTLTEGQPQLLAIHPLGGGDERRLLALVAAAEEGSEHPLAGAFLRAAGERAVAVPAAAGFVATPGRGVCAEVEGHQVVVGSPRFLAEQGSPAPAERVAELGAQGLTAVVAAIDGAAAAVFGLGDAPRPGAAEAVRRLRARGIEVVMLTGDSRAVAAQVAAELGITRVVAETLPEAKADEVAALRQAGRRVAMVGDGVNDAPALAAAQVGIAMGSAADIAAESAGVVLLRDDLPALAGTVALARRTLRTIRQNLFWAFAYNVVALPIAAAGLLSPMLAGAAMSLSSVSVVLNSLRLRRFRGRAS